MGEQAFGNHWRSRKDRQENLLKMWPVTTNFLLSKIFLKLYLSNFCYFAILMLKTYFKLSNFLKSLLIPLNATSL